MNSESVTTVSNYDNHIPTYAELLAKVGQLQKTQTQLKQQINDKNKKIVELETEIYIAEQYADFLFDTIAIQEQERNELEASLKGNATIKLWENNVAINDCTFLVSAQTA